MHSVLFIGGPSDGRHVVLAHLPREYRVALQPEFTQSAVGGVEGQVFLDPRTFDYTRLSVPYLTGMHVYVPVDWTNNAFIDPVQRVLTALVRGYVGRGE